MNPYNRQEITEILSRPYLVKTISWAHTAVALSNLDTLQFPQLLYGIPNIIAKLTNFKFLNAGVKIEVRINATQFHIGRVAISYLPHTPPTGSLAVRAANTAIQRLQNNCTILSCSGANSATITIPRDAPTVSNLIDSTADWDIATMWVDVLVPLQIASSSTLPDPISITIWASFVDPEPIGYGYNILTPVMLKNLLKASLKNTVKPNLQSSSSISAESAAKSKAGVISGVMEAASNFAPVIAASPFAEFAPIAAAVGSMAPFVKSLGFSKPTTVQAMQPVTQDSFRDWAHGHGLDVSNKLSLHPDAKLGLSNYCECRKHPIKEIIGKPGLVGYFSIPYGTAVDTPLAFWPSNPSLSYFVAGMSSFTYTPTPLAYVAQMFKGYRGGMKYYYMFVTSSFTTARIRISKFPSAALPGSIEQSAGDNVSDVVDIRGDTEFTDTVPFISRFVYNQIPGLNSMSPDDTGPNIIPPQEDDSWVCISLANEVANPDPTATCGIDVLIFAAAAEDMTLVGFSGLMTRKTKFETTAVPDKPVLQSLNTIFSKQFKPSAGAKGTQEAGFSSSEHYSTIEELCLRYSLVDASQSFGTVPIPNNISLVNAGGSALSTTQDILGYLAPLFVYYRGGLRYRIPLQRLARTSTNASQRYMVEIGFDSWTPPSTVHFVDQFGDLRQVGDTQFQTYIGFEVPWLANVPVRTTGEPDDNEDDGNLEMIYLKDFDTGAGLVIPDFYRSAADDFTFGYQVATPEYVGDNPLFKKGKEPALKQNEKNVIAQSDMSVSRFANLLFSPSTSPSIKTGK